MDTPISTTLGLLSSNPNHLNTLDDFNTRFNHLNTLISTSNLHSPNPNQIIHRTEQNTRSHTSLSTNLRFSSTSISLETQIENPPKPTSQNWLKPTTRDNPRVRSLLRNLSVFERALIGAGGGGIAGAFTYVCLHPLDTIKTKLQTRGASEIYSGTLDAIVKTFQNKGILGFYSGVSAVIVGSTASSAVYFGTCEFGKSILSKLPQYPPLLIPPTAGAMGNIVSSAIMVPKELITQRMQAGAKGRSWEVLLRILEKDGVLGLYAGYSATLLRNLPAGVLSYSSFEYLKAAVLSKTKKANLEPLQSVCCGALAGAISASLTTPLDVVKTRLMTQVHGEAVNKVTAAVYSGVSATVKQILKEEGWVGLTSGMGPRVLHSACFSALGYFAFETARLSILHQYLKHKESSEMAVAPP
ncbi:protein MITOFERRINLIKE 1, chloroplastic [Cornus florida]|uniref:protein MITOFERRINLIKE 1, chloroplastic n=1 Tax=Cornus florida TaxID=4283 RepID=UPI0028A0CDB1|nr:protein MITOFERRINLIKE 1, chloroplastic [Cornus florida]XP_059630529.1 protein MITOFERRINLIKE 1, chloroplastic [Cornus florida]